MVSEGDFGDPVRQGADRTVSPSVAAELGRDLLPGAKGRGRLESRSLSAGPIVQRVEGPLGVGRGDGVEPLRLDADVKSLEVVIGPVEVVHVLSLVNLSEWAISERRLPIETCRAVGTR